MKDRVEGHLCSTEHEASNLGNTLWKLGYEPERNTEDAKEYVLVPAFRAQLGQW